MTTQTTSATPASGTLQAWAAIVLVALAAGACDKGGTPTSPTSPATSPPPPLRIAALTVTETAERSGQVHPAYVYVPTLTLTAGADAVTVTELWIEVEDRYDGSGESLRDNRLPYRIPAGATARLFDNPTVAPLRPGFRAARAWAIVAYVDASGRHDTIQSAPVSITR